MATCYRALVDLDSYLRRIDYCGVRQPDRNLLAQIVQRHTQSIAFENLDAFLGRRVSLDPPVVERKLVHEGRGGWCFEHNLLLGNALRTLGFAVTDLAARVLWNRPLDAVTARTHRLLLVRADGGDWLVDVGFGGQTPTGVLDLHSEAVQETPHEPFRLRRLGQQDRVLEALIAGEWKLLYRFDLQAHLPIDFEAANFQLAHDPDSNFRQWLGVSRVARDGRHSLRGRELAFHRVGGDTMRQELANASEVVDALRAVFGLSLDATLATALMARLDAQAGSAARS